MASIDAMSWDGCRYWFGVGYRDYLEKGPETPPPFPSDRRCGLWVAGKDAARKHPLMSCDEAWRRFRAREEAVL